MILILHQHQNTPIIKVLSIKLPLNRTEICKILNLMQLKKTLRYLIINNQP